MIDKKKIFSNFGSLNNVALELGCGNRKRSKNAIGIDAIDYDCVDIVGDIFEVLSRFPSKSISRIEAYHFFSHVENQLLLLQEVNRLLKSDGILKIVAPHFSNPFFYSDPTHRKFFGLYTMAYYASNKIFSRTVPNYQYNLNLTLTSVKLIFKSVPPRYIRHAIKKLFQSFVNSSNWCKEFYEENLCYFIPCYEIEYLISSTKPTNEIIN